MSDTGERQSGMNLAQRDKGGRKVRDGRED